MGAGLLNKKLKNVRHKIEYSLLLVPLFILRLIPFSFSMKAADSCAGIISSLIPVRRKIIIRNLRTAFPEKSNNEIHSLYVQTIRSFLLFIVEFIHFPERSLDDLKSQVTSIEGEEYYREAGKDGKPFLVLTAHMGNWELMGAYFSSLGLPVSVLAKPVHNPFLDHLVNSTRKDKGLEVISTRKQAIKPVLKALRNGRCVAFLADQDARKSGVFADFFGKPASTFTGPAMFSIRSGLPLLPVFDVRTGQKSHKVVFHPPLYPPEKTDRESAIREMTEKHVKILEDMIRRYPGQYFWFHRRWKTQPR